MPRRAANISAFTLIELLLVVSIIGVLVGLAIPALGRARETARRTQCLANLRSFGQGLQMYMNDSKDRLPYVRPLHDTSVPGGPAGGGNDESLLSIMQNYLNVPLPRREIEGDTTSPFTGVSDMFKCPGDRQSTDAASNFEPLWRTTGVSYEYYAGSMMFGAYMATVPEKVAPVAVTKVFELPQWRELPVMMCFAEWHPLRSRGLKKNALYFGDWRAEWASDLAAPGFLSTRRGADLICDIVKTFGGVTGFRCD